MIKTFFSLILASSLIGEPSSEEVFTHIYDEGSWGKNEFGEGTSGDGSSLCNALPYMELITQFLHENEIESVFDAGCGDWELFKHIDWGEIDYIGLDTVKGVIAKNQKNHGSRNIRFVHGDLLETSFPGADLLICKDVLQHLTNEDIFVFLEKISAFEHCLITNDVDPNTDTAENENILRGKHRFVDLEAPPFNLKATEVFYYPSYLNYKKVFYLHNPQSQ